MCRSCRSLMLPVTFCGSPGWGSLEPQPTDWPGAGARVWFPAPARALPGWDCPLWPAPSDSDCYPMLTWPGGPTRQQILPGNTDSAEIRGLEGGVSYSVRVTALVGDREGAPVSIVVTTRRQSSGWGEPGLGEPWLVPLRLGGGACAREWKGDQGLVVVNLRGRGLGGRCAFQGWPGIGTDGEGRSLPDGCAFFL